MPLGANGVPLVLERKAPQACVTCKKQKRKCDKVLPNCGLCFRMQRHCDYTEQTPAPTAEDINALRMKLVELESKVNGGNMHAPYATPSGPISSGPEYMQPHLPAYVDPQESPFNNIQNKFPVMAVLDNEIFRNEGQVLPVPRPAVNPPPEVNQMLATGLPIPAVILEYFGTIHHCLPIISHNRLERMLTTSPWDNGADLSLLFLCMKLITSKPVDGQECRQNPMYIAAKRFVALLEASGMVSLILLQASILITLFEYGQAIYPAAWMSAGWCSRYAILLGINGFDTSPQLIGPVDTWTEQEERHRTWWGVLILDRMVSIGSKSHLLTTQEPKEEDPLPVDDIAWDNGDMTQTVQRSVSTSLTESVTPFARLCQGSVLLGNVLRHHYTEKIPSETARFDIAYQLFESCSVLAREVNEEAVASRDYLMLATPLAIIYSAIIALLDPYSRPADGSCSAATSSEKGVMMNQAIKGLQDFSQSVVQFAECINSQAQTQQDLDKVSPLIMDSLWAAGQHYMWAWKESRNPQSQEALEIIRNCLRRFQTRWRNAAEYLRIFDGQEFGQFTSALGSAKQISGSGSGSGS
ncbi:hypothetical protein SS1G_05931 [Sclerotinia sclerotiorum 1980 UF-70]|uniref:Zn(2)-C6 fungal-type domain-containing protein n=1 Tax=Sclerotinia sclerotiorum (strain ATCC 18683 / 1980 / Ss-1) TaxID=665079 RepID=A7EKT4_SCLS1|nr:hypothetical protein SS1G_05931 [Sclerotinia sclerotiorum 1980 UF-70]EDO03450.1 hypothetical protein SS1G_05931 [Sclerotinia sclerotiorum 1980 UF-70]